MKRRKGYLSFLKFLQEVFMRVFVFLFIASVMPLTALNAGSAPTRQEVEQALHKAITFFHKEASSHGGYVWKYSADLQYRMGEGVATRDMMWTQPPGTPAVGEAFLEAYRTTGNKQYLDAATDAARALVKGQLQSGGWYYHVEFDPAKRGKFSYRDQPKVNVPDPDAGYVGGWEVWRMRKYQGNMSLMDDDVTQSSLRLLMQVDEALKFEDKAIHEAVEYGLKAVANVQYANGAWSHNYDRFEVRPPDASHYPVKQASYPKTWSRKWTKDFAGCYYLNDRVTPNGVKAFLLAHQIYKKQEYLDVAEKGGGFFLLAQLPEPQPAWAQQYDRNMQPVWDRKFEPPAITGLESQDVLETLLVLYQHTGNKKYLEPVPKALAYLRKSLLPDGKVARFYELQTNKPLFFDGKYQLTSDSSQSPDHYGFLFESRLDQIEKEYQRLAALPADRLTPPPPPNREELTGKVKQILKQMDARGTWLEPGFVRDLQGRKVPSPQGIIQAQTFVDNVHIMCLYLQATKP
jgi:hypothetical protein